MAKLFDLGAQARVENMNHAARHTLRMERAPSVLEELKTQIEAASRTALPSSPLGKASSYTLRLWDKLTRFLDYAELELSNNLAENSMRPWRLAVETGPTSVTRRPDHASPQSSPSSKPAADSRSPSASTSPLSCQGSPTLPSRDFQNSLQQHGALEICNCQYAFV